MKKRENIRDAFGISQEDLAIVLKVSRSQLAMFETGKRQLPSTALLQLAEILRYLQEDASKSADTTSLLKAQAIQKEKALEHLVKENHYKQFALEKKLNVLEKKYNASLYDRRILNSNKLLLRDYWTSPLGTNNISKDVEINKGLWDIAERIASIKNDSYESPLIAA